MVGNNLGTRHATTKRISEVRIGNKVGTMMYTNKMNGVYI